MSYKRNKIIALPYAGGTKYSFNSLEKHMPEHLDWITLEPPGRGKRITERLLDTVDEMVQDLLVQITPLIQDDDYIIYGHSMGTLLGYELAKNIVNKKLKPPTCLYFTGRGAPSCERKEEKKSSLPEDLFWEEVQKMGGLPKEILDHAELLELYYPILKSDFKAIEDYKYHKMERQLSIPIHICMGTEEIGTEEEKTTMAEMKAWENETISSCTFELLEGDHFFILEHTHLLAQKISAFATRGREQVSPTY